MSDAAQTPKPLIQAEILEPNSAAASLDALNLRIALQVAPYRWKSSLHQLLKSVEVGAPLDQALEQTRGRMPNDLRSLLAVALKLPEPTRFLLDSLMSSRDTRQIWMQLLHLIAYPLGMLTFAAAVCLLVSNLLYYTVMGAGFEDFGLTGMEEALSVLDDQRLAIIAVFVILVWCLVVWLTIRLLAPRWARVAILGGLPLAGKPLRWINLYEMLSRYQIVSRQGVPVNQLADAVASSLHGSEQEMAAKGTAARIASGMTMGTALTRSSISDGLCAPILLSIDQYRALHDGCSYAAATLRTIVESRCRMLTNLMPLFVISTILTMIWGTLSGYLSVMRVLIKMITSLA